MCFKLYRPCLLVAAAASAVFFSGCSTIKNDNPHPQEMGKIGLTIDFPAYSFDQQNRDNAFSTVNIDQYYRSAPRKIGASLYDLRPVSVNFLSDSDVIEVQHSINDFLYDSIRNSSGVDLVTDERADIRVSAWLHDFDIQSSFRPAVSNVSPSSSRLEFNPSTCTYNGSSSLRLEVRHRDNNDLIYSRNFGGSVRYLYETREPDCIVPISLKREILTGSLEESMKMAQMNLVEWWKPYGQIISISSTSRGKRIARINLGSLHGIKPGDRISIHHTSDIGLAGRNTLDITTSHAVASEHIDRESAWVVLDTRSSLENLRVARGNLVSLE